MQKVIFLLLIVLIFFVSMSFHPSIVEITDMEEIEQGTILNPYITRLFILILLLSCLVNRKFIIIYGTNIFIKAILSIFFTILFFSLLSFSIFDSPNMFSDLRAIAISLASVFIGFRLSMTKKQVFFLFLFFCISVFFVSLLQIFINGQGFVILQTYDVTQKNSLGALIATAIIIGFGIIHFSNHSLSKRFLGIIIVILGYVIIITIRARTATIASLVVSLFMLYRFHRQKNLVSFFTISALLIFVVLFLMPDYIIRYIVDSFILGREDDITSGRSERIAPVLHFLSTHLWLGNLNSNEKFSIVHIFCLYKIYQYGILFSMPIIVLYLYFPLFDYNCIRSIKKIPIEGIGLFSLMIPFLISLQEYSFPFGPGTATIFNFILFGYSLQHINVNEIC